MPATLLLSVQDAEIRFGDNLLFQDLAFNIQEGDKICLVGKNGAGKTTLMQVIRGLRELDAGTRWQLQGLRIGYLQQDITPREGQSVFDFVFEELKGEEQKENNAYKVERVLEPLQLNPQDALTGLSGGQLRRAALARALVEEPDILLLDEPTNHLDLEAIEWLEGFLRAYRGALLCVSHDRAFLANISDKVFWLDRGSLRVCPKGFRFFEDWSIALLEQEERTLHNRQKMLDQEVDWASRGVKARRKRNVRRLDLMKAERDKLRSDKNALSRMLAQIELTPQEESTSASRLICEFYHVCKAFEPRRQGAQGKTILDKFSLRIRRGDRIGIVGKNGAGKTTFLKLLLGETKQDSGTIKRVKDLALAYFDQTRADLRLDWTLQRNLIPGGGDYIEVMGKTRHICGYLKDFLFEPQSARQSASTLSGGQKNRLLLAKILANPGDLLILDEPTNDLDMDTLDRLEDILSAYQGTLIVVSHDRDFLDQTVSKIIAFEGNGVVEAHIGGYADYLAARRAAASGAASATPPAAAKVQQAAPEKRQRAEKLSFSLLYELEHLPARIAALEAEIGQTEKTLADPAFYERDAEGFMKKSALLTAKNHELEQALARWVELEDKRAALTPES